MAVKFDPILGKIREEDSGAGDMVKATYDPQNIAGDVFARANHTGTQAASTISDFDTEVSNNTDVAAPQGKMHAHDGTSGFIFKTITGIVNASQTIIPDGTGDVTKTFYGTFILDNAGPTSTVWEIPNNSFVDWVVGSGTFRIAVSAAGAMTVIRQSGTGTGVLTVMGTWQ